MPLFSVTSLKVQLPLLKKSRFTDPSVVTPCETRRSSQPSRLKSAHAALKEEPGASAPDSLMTSVKTPFPSLRMRELLAGPFHPLRAT